MHSSWLIFGFIVGYSAVQGHPPLPLPNSDRAFQWTDSNETDVSAAMAGTESFTQQEADSLANDSLIADQINSTADTLTIADSFEDNNMTDTLIVETTAVSGATFDRATSSTSDTVDKETPLTKGSMDNDSEGALINTTFELVPTLRRSEPNQPGGNGILVPIAHQKLPGGDGTISNMSLIISPSIVNRFSHSPVAELNSSSETIKFESNSTGPANKTVNETELADKNGLQSSPDDPFEDRVGAEKSENEELSTTAIVRSEAPSSTTSKAESGSTRPAVDSDGASRSLKTTTVAALWTPYVKFDQQGCGQRGAASLTAAERNSVVAFQFADLQVPTDVALEQLCRFLFGAVSHGRRSQFGENNLFASSFLIVNDTISEAKQGSWTKYAILFDATGKAIESNAASNLLMKHNFDNKLEKIGKLVGISPTTQKSTEDSSRQTTFWQLLDDPLIVTATSAVVVALCLVLVGSLCGLVCWHRYSTRFKGEWIVQGGRSSIESEMWYDNDAFAAGQKYPGTRGIHPTYYGRHTSVGQLTNDFTHPPHLVR